MWYLVLGEVKELIGALFVLDDRDEALSDSLGGNILKYMIKC